MPLNWIFDTSQFSGRQKQSAMYRDHLYSQTISIILTQFWIFSWLMPLHSSNGSRKCMLQASNVENLTIQGYNAFISLRCVSGGITQGRYSFHTLSSIYSILSAPTRYAYMVDKIGTIDMMTANEWFIVVNPHSHLFIISPMISIGLPRFSARFHLNECRIWM